MNKPRMVEVTDAAEIAELMADAAGIGVPFTVRIQWNTGVGEQRVMANADELRAWRELRSQHTSSEKQP